MQSTGKAVVRLMTPRPNERSAAIRSIKGARDVIPGRRLIAASIMASRGSRGSGVFTGDPNERQPTTLGEPEQSFNAMLPEDTEQSVPIDCN